MQRDCAMRKEKMKTRRFNLCSVYDVANYYLANSENVTNKKLQLIVFYAYAWHLTLNNENANELNVRLFENKFEAWIHGAVYPELYNSYKQYGSSVIPKYNGNLYAFSPDELSVLTQVNEVYGQYDGNQLESINHQETPWIKARRGLAWDETSHVLINDKDIFECFIQEAV